MPQIRLDRDKIPQKDGSYELLVTLPVQQEGLFPVQLRVDADIVFQVIPAKELLVRRPGWVPRLSCELEIRGGEVNPLQVFQLCRVLGASTANEVVRQAQLRSWVTRCFGIDFDVIERILNRFQLDEMIHMY
jgi:hypothetical protein